MNIGHRKRSKCGGMKENYIEWYVKNKPSVLTTKIVAKIFGVSQYKAKKIIKILVEAEYIRYGYYYSDLCGCLNEGQSYHDCEQYPPFWGYFNVNDKSITFKQPNP